MATISHEPEQQSPPNPLGEVLTLAEAAACLRVSEDDVLAAIAKQRLPGRTVQTQWRFLKSALEDWLRVSDERSFWTTHFGALSDDPYLDEMLEGIYRERGRPMTEAG